MITAIGPAGTSRPVDQLRAEAPKAGTPAAKAEAAPESAAAPLNPAAELASAGAPIDAEKISSIKAALANGTYKIDPQAIARKMIALDLPATAR